MIDQIRQFAKEAGAKEACGFVETDGQRLRAVQTNNLAPNPSFNFVVDVAGAYMESQKAGRLVGYWHTHPPGSPTQFSDEDKAVAESLAKPCWLYCADNDKLTVYTPTGYRPPLEGRSFIPFVQDCFALVRDYYSEKLGIDIPDVERDETDYNEGHKSFGAFLASIGAVRIVGKPQKHDVLAITTRTRTGRPNHFAVYVGNGLMLHQVRGKRSGFDLWAGYWQNNTATIWRHPKLCSQPLHSTESSAKP